ncbi:hypothetical protein LTR85_004408 [Meristemomyces frigidus]|nr:hypothetical protein LTR85_004408 [Meristemomyces frigidus]
MPLIDESEDTMLEPRTARGFEPYSGPIPPQPKQTLWKRILSWVQSVCSGSRPTKSSSKSRNKLQKPPPSFRRAFTRQEQQTVDEASSALPPQQAPHEVELAAMRPLSRKASKRSSIFGLTSLLDRFAYDVERTFLTPVEKTILERMQQVTGEGKRIRPLLQTEPEILLMPDRDSADAVAAVRRLTRYLPEAEKEMVSHDLDRLLTREQRAVLRRVLHDSNDFEVRCVGVESKCQTPDSVMRGSHWQALRDSPARNVTFGDSARAASVGGVLHRVSLFTEEGITTVRQDGEVRRGSCLRGGGDNAGQAARPTFDLSNLTRRPRRLEDDERPPATLWWLAGGCIRQDMATLGVPTAATLRERRRVEMENGEIVGFWGTLAGVRAVKKTRSQLADVCQRIAAASGDAGSVAAEPGEEEKKRAQAIAEDEEVQGAGQAEQKAEDAAATAEDAEKEENGNEEAKKEGDSGACEKV